MARRGAIAGIWIWPLLGARGVFAHLNGALTLVAENCNWNPAGPLMPSEDSQRCPLIVDDETGGITGQWKPWTHRPTCAYPSNATESKYCVFSFAPFRGTSAIAFMTDPETAAETVSLLEDPDWNWEPWPPEDSSVWEKDPPWEIVDIPNKGKGVVATRKIREGGLLMRDSAVVIGMLRPPSTVATPHRQILLSRAFQQLPKKQQDEVMALATSKGGPILDDIMGTNIFGISLAGREGHMGLFPLISRINHDCRPNAIIRFSSRRLTMEVVAYRDIPAGEELSISYTPLNMVTEDRRQVLRRWNFDCACSLCSSPARSQVSDRNRRRIQEILAAMDEPDNREYESLLSLTDEMMEIVEAEGLRAQVGDFFSILAHAYNETGFLGTARRFAAQSVEKYREFVGVDSQQVKTATEFLESLPQK